MTSTKDFASKAVVAFAAIALAFSVFAAPAKAQSTEDLQKMINDLLAQVAALQASTGQGATSVASGVCPFTWTRDLNVGATGADVMKLQQFLNANADTRVSASGAGSVGMETETYGPATAAAVSKMQVMYRADILTPAGLVNPTGYFGPSTRAKANSLCVATAPVVTPVDPVVTPGDDDEDNTAELSGEASLDTLEIDSASDDTIEEGEKDVEIAEVTVQFQDGDASISRMDVTLNGVADVWDVLETVSLWVDGDMVAKMTADDEDEYLDTTVHAGTLRFSGLDIVGMEDEDVVITIGATIQGNVDNSDQGSYTVAVDSIRFFDADGVSTTENDPADFELADTVNFTIEAAGSDDEVIVKTASSDPDGTTLQLENDKKSDDYTVFAFDIDTDDSTNDIELNTVVVNLLITEDASTTPVASYNNLIDDVELVIDGVTIDDVTVTGATSTAGTAILTFDVDGDVTIDAGDRVTAKLVVTFKSLALGNEGATIKASITSAIDAEGADDVPGTGSATGDTHTLRTSGAVITAGDMTETRNLNSDATSTDDSGTFVLKFEVTAFEQDLYVNKTAVSGTVAGTEGVNFEVTNGSGALSATEGTPTASLSSSASTEGAQFKVAEGETETFTLTVSVDPTAKDFYGVRLYSFNFDETLGSNPSAYQLALPIEDYETDPLEVLN